jgi:hypothetical protein
VYARVPYLIYERETREIGDRREKKQERVGHVHFLFLLQKAKTMKSAGSIHNNMGLGSPMGGGGGMSRQNVHAQKKKAKWEEQCEICVPPDALTVGLALFTTFFAAIKPLDQHVPM